MQNLFYTEVFYTQLDNYFFCCVDRGFIIKQNQNAKKSMCEKIQNKFFIAGLPAENNKLYSTRISKTESTLSYFVNLELQMLFPLINGIRASSQIVFDLFTKKIKKKNS